MPLQVRRVVTGHDAQGRAIVEIDDVLSGAERRPKTSAAVIWTTEGFPVDNTGKQDEGLREVGTTHANGTVFRVLQLEPGNAQRMHRTDSIDYAVIMSGEIDMELEPGDFVHLKAGDVLVQRGTIHNWVNNGSEACTIAFVLIDAKPVEVNGKVLHAQG
ncbi:MAG TPA: cupin domain-containing protein [Dehalococcoidia bacterium]|nr:cupin domain-containing protein [Dehalococcoidia bacterium]